MDTAIARQQLADIETQMNGLSVLAAPAIPPELTKDQEAFLRGKTWTRDEDGVIIVVHSGPIVGKIPRGVICRPARPTTKVEPHRKQRSKRIRGRRASR